MSEHDSQAGKSSDPLMMPAIGTIVTSAIYPGVEGEVTRHFTNAMLVRVQEKHGMVLYLVRREGDRLLRSHNEWPEVGEEVPVWVEGHAMAECVGHNDDGSPQFRLLPIDDVFDPEDCDYGWNVEMD